VKAMLVDWVVTGLLVTGLLGQITQKKIKNFVKQPLYLQLVNQSTRN
jgi:hypothetical protein